MFVSSWQSSDLLAGDCLANDREDEANLVMMREWGVVQMMRH